MSSPYANKTALAGQWMHKERGCPEVFDTVILVVVIDLSCVGWCLCWFYMQKNIYYTLKKTKAIGSILEAKEGKKDCRATWIDHGKRRGRINESAKQQKDICFLLLILSQVKNYRISPKSDLSSFRLVTKLQYVYWLIETNLNQLTLTLWKCVYFYNTHMK